MLTVAVRRQYSSMYENIREAISTYLDCISRSHFLLNGTADYYGFGTVFSRAVWLLSASHYSHQMLNFLVKSNIVATSHPNFSSHARPAFVLPLPVLGDCHIFNAKGPVKGINLTYYLLLEAGKQGLQLVSTQSGLVLQASKGVQGADVNMILEVIKGVAAES